MAKKKTGGGGTSASFNGPTGIRHGYGEGEWNSNQKAKLRGETPGAAPMAASPRPVTFGPVSTGTAAPSAPKSGGGPIQVGGTTPPSNSPPSTSFQARYNPGGGGSAPSAPTPSATPTAPTAAATPARAAAAHRPRAARPAATTATPPTSVSMTAMGGARRASAANMAPKTGDRAALAAGATATKTGVVQSQAAAAERVAAPYGRNRAGNPRAIDPNGGMARTRANMERIGVAGDARAVDSMRRTEGTQGGPRFAGIGARDTGMRGASVADISSDHRQAGSGALRGHADDLANPMRSAVRFATIPAAAAVATMGAVAAAPVIASGAPIVAGAARAGLGRAAAAAPGMIRAAAPRVASAVRGRATSMARSAGETLRTAANTTVGKTVRGVGAATAAHSAMDAGNNSAEGGTDGSFAQRHPTIAGGLSLLAGALGSGTISPRGAAPAAAATGVAAAAQARAPRTETMAPTGGPRAQARTGRVATLPAPARAEATPMLPIRTPSGSQAQVPPMSRANASGAPRRPTMAAPTPGGRTDNNWSESMMERAGRGTRTPAAGSAATDPQPQFDQRNVEARRAQMNSQTTARRTPARQDTSPEITEVPTQRPATMAGPRSEAPAATPRTPTMAAAPPPEAPSVRAVPSRRTPVPRRAPAAAPETPGTPVQATPAPSAGTVRRPVRGGPGAAASATGTAADLVPSAQALNAAARRPVAPSSSSGTPRRRAAAPEAVTRETRPPEAATPEGRTSVAEGLRRRGAVQPAPRGEFVPRRNGLQEEEGFAGPSGINHGAFSHASGGGLVRGEPNLTPIKSNHGFGRSNSKF